MSTAIAALRSKFSWYDFRQTLIPWVLLMPAMAFLIWLLLGYGVFTAESFHDWTSSERTIPGFSLVQYVRFFKTPLYYRGFLRSIKIGVIVTILSLLWAYPLAYHISKSPRSGFFMAITILPMFLCVLVITYAWLVLLTPSGLLNTALLRAGLIKEPIKILFTERAIIFGLTHESVPYLVIPLLISLQKIPRSIEESAEILGATGWQKFWRITFPLSMPGVLSGTTIIYALAVAAFAAPILLGGRQVEMISVSIERQVGFYINWPFGGAISVLLAIFVLLFLALYGGFLRSRFLQHLSL